MKKMRENIFAAVAALALCLAWGTGWADESRLSGEEEQNLVSPLPEDWTLRASRGSDGKFFFTVTAPVENPSVKSSRLPSSVQAAITPEYAGMELATLVPYPGELVFRITGTAANRAALEALSITRISYAFADEPEILYLQNFDPAMTYASIPNKTVDPDPSGDGGCCAGGAFGLIALVLLPAVKYISRKPGR